VRSREASGHLLGDRPPRVRGAPDHNPPLPTHALGFHEVAAGLPSLASRLLPVRAGVLLGLEEKSVRCKFDFCAFPPARPALRGASGAPICALRLLKSLTKSQRTIGG